MSIEIKKTGKNTYYRKDGNKMGRRKEKQEVVNISLKYWETDMAIRHRARSKLTSGSSIFDGMLSGGLKKSEIAMIGAICGAFPEDNFKSNVSSGIVKTATDRGRVVMIGMEHEFDHTDRLAEEIKNQFEYLPYNRQVQLAYVDGVPYNPMDEFDRPEFYKEKQFIVDMPDSIYPKNPEEVLSEQFKIDVNDTHQKLVTDTINSFVNVNKPYKLVIDNEGRQSYPETFALDGINLKTSLDKVPETYVDENAWLLKELNVKNGNFEPVDIFKDYISLDFFLDLYNHVNFNVNALVKVIDDILAKDNKEVLVIDKEDDSTYFLKIDARYKSVIVDKDRLEIDPESAINTEAYTTIQESLLKLLESIKGDNEFLLTYKIENDKGCEAFIIKKEWYMKKFKIILNIPDRMIEPNDVYTFMSSTGISEEEKENTLSKRLDKFLEGTGYNWSIEEKMVPDNERTMLYRTKLIKDNIVTSVNELDNKMYYTKIEALAETYKILYNFKKDGLIKFEKEEVTFPTEDVFKHSNVIEKSHPKPMLFMDVTIEELIENIASLLPENTSYEVITTPHIEGMEPLYSINYTYSSGVNNVVVTWSSTQAEALCKFYIYLRNNKGK